MAVFFRGMDVDERVALTGAMAQSGDDDDVGPCRPSRPGGRQAFDGRRRRQGQPDAGTAGGRVRRARADDLRPRPRAHRRHVRQAREHPRLPDDGPTTTCSTRSSPRSAAPSSDRHPSSLRPTAGSTRFATSPPRSSPSPLITASILSKKLAAGLDALVMDVTFGNGAFMSSFAQAEELAHSIVAVAGGAGLNDDGVADRHEPGARPHRRQRPRGTRVDRLAARHERRTTADRGRASPSAPRCWCSAVSPTTRESATADVGRGSSQRLRGRQVPSDGDGTRRSARSRRESRRASAASAA